MRTAAALLVACLALGCGGDDGLTFDAEGVERWAETAPVDDPVRAAEIVQEVCTDGDDVFFRTTVEGFAADAPPFLEGLAIGCPARVVEVLGHTLDDFQFPGLLNE